MSEKNIDYTKPEVIDTPTVRIHKPSIFEKFADTFLAQDIHEVGEYVITDVIIPAIKKTLVEIIKNGAEMLFYGETKASKINDPTNPWTSYNAYYQSGSKSNRSGSDNRLKGGSDNYRLEFRTRAQAEEAKENLLELIRTYKSASIADFCEISRAQIKITDQEIAKDIPAKWNDNDWGWYDLTANDIEVVRLFNGFYTLKLPKPTYLK